MSEETLLNFFESHNLKYQIYTHHPLFNVEDATSIKSFIPGAHIKNLFLKDKKKSFFLVNVLDHKRVDLRSLSKTVGKGSLSFGNSEELFNKLQLPPGAVTPCALIYDVNKEISLILDKDILDNEIVNFHPMRNDRTVSLSLKSFLNFLDIIGHTPTVLEIPILTLPHPAPTVSSSV